jgi:hypothetical protein
VAEELAVKLGVKHSTSTIRKYMVTRREPRVGQTWKTFMKNHAKQSYSCDFLTQYTALFTVVYIFVVMEIATRKIVHVNVTTSPSLSWDFIFLNARHILQVCRKDVSYYNGARPSQALHAIPYPYPELMNPQAETGRVAAIPVLGGVQHDYRRAA